MADTTTIQELIFTDDAWHLVQPFEDKTSGLTIKNNGDTTVRVYVDTEGTLTEKTIEKYLEDNYINPPEIGGILYECSSHTSDLVFVKCPEGNGKISVRIFGTVDPTADVLTIGQAQAQLDLQLTRHLEATSGNPHNVTKADVGLSKIPNAVSSNPDDTSISQTNGKNTLATLEAVRIVKRYTQDHATRTDNPHSVTKTQIGLSRVENYAIATDAQALDRSLKTAYMTPYTTALMMSDYAVIASSMKAQTVVQGATASRPAGWMDRDCSPVPGYIIKTSTNRAYVAKGLRVAFAYHNCVRLSKELESNFSIPISSSMSNGIHYVYVDLDETGVITSVGHTTFAPVVVTSGTDSVTGDFYNEAACTMHASDGTEIYRVYIGKLYFLQNEIIDVIAVPFGSECVIPIEETLNLGRSILVPNPYIMPVETHALVEYNGRWGETKWNDQTGISASPRPGYALDEIIVQAGSVGFLTKGSSSGTGFSGDFTTITTPMRVAVNVHLVR